MAEYMYTNDPVAYEENSQPNSYIPPASPMTQETTTIHYIPSNNVNDWDTSTSNYQATGDNYGHSSFYTIERPIQQQQITYYSEDAYSNSAYYSPYQSQMQSRQYNSFPRVSYELEWDQPTPVLINRRNNEAMKQFMRFGGSGGGCVVMQPTQRERIATPRAEYVQRFQPYNMDSQLSITPIEINQGLHYNVCNNECVNEQQYFALNIPSESASINNFVEHQDQSEAINNISVYQADTIPNASTATTDESQMAAENEETKAQNQNEHSNLGPRSSSDERNAIVNEVLSLEKEAANICSKT